MTCDEYQEMASQFIDDELEDNRSKEFFSHLSRCAECRAFLRGSLELRSRIQDEILLTRQHPVVQDERFTTTFLVPLAALVGTITLLVGISQWTPNQPADIAFPAVAGTREMQLTPVYSSWPGRIP